MPFLGIGIGIAVTAAGLGLVLGALCRDYRTVQPLLLVTAAGSFFASGGYASVATLPPLVRTLNAFWPPAYVFETMQLTIHSTTLPDLTNMLLALPLTPALGVAVGWMLLRRML
ncbi:MAG: ABC transporter permease [Chloroflexales bacterium]|nr:ABC transporter permease [Chloroflexales bacterium]